jgi:CheY-like chemotaxis protein
MAKVLLVDDTPATTEHVAEHLRKVGHEVTYLPNGREALAHVLANLPDVVVLDLLMPEMDGPSFLEVVRSYLRLLSLPVVVLTAMGDSPMIARAQALKVNAVLAKDKASLEDIRRAVEDAVSRLPG